MACPSTAGIREQLDSRDIKGTFSNKTLTRIFHVDNGDPVTVEKLGPQYGEQFLGENLFVSEKSAKRLGTADGFCELAVVYKTPELGEANRDSWELDLTAQTVHISSVRTRADQTHEFIETSRETGRSREIVERVGTLIGVNGDEIEGVDIYVPAATLTINIWKNASEVDTAFWRRIQAVSGHTNDAGFWGWEPGELLSLGAVLAQTEGEQVNIRYKFLGEVNEPSLQFELLELGTQRFDTVNVNGPAGAGKGGWEYLWTQDGKDIVESPSGTETHKGTIGVHIAKVYEKASFADIGVPTNEQPLITLSLSF